MRTPILSMIGISCLLLLSIHGFGQYQIKGKIVDQNNVPIFYAHVIVHNAIDSMLISGEVTDEKGNFELSIKEEGSYYLKAKMIGFKDVSYPTFQLNNSNPNQDIGTLQLAEDSALLDEVQIVEKRALVEQKIDRMVVNVDSRISSAGSTALDVLKKSPGVLVNPQSGDITMSGKSGVVVMIDGKISRMPTDAVMQMLDGMNSANVERIELIHTPPAEFDAQANAGFINIILKERQDLGLNGGYNLSAAYGKGEKFSGGIDLNFRKNRWNIYGDYSMNFNSWPQQFENYRAFSGDGVLFETDGVSDRKPTTTLVNNGRIGIDFQATEKTVIGGLFSYFNRAWDMVAINDIRTLRNGELIERLSIPNDEINDRFKLHYNFNVDHKINECSNLIFDVDYVFIKSDNPSSYTNEFYDSNDALLNSDSLRVFKVTPMDIFVSRIDYHNQLNENLKLDFGIKGTSISFENDILVEENMSGAWDRVDIFSSFATLDERIAAMYGSLSYSLDKTSFQFGLRYEYTDTKLATIDEPNLVDRQFSNLFPSLFVTRQITETNALNFSYRKGINRPGFWDLAPFFIFWDPNTVLTGNPSLLSSVNHDFRLAYNIKTLQLSSRYSYALTPIARWQPQVDLVNNTQVNGAKNFVDGHLLNFTLSYPIQLTDWWELRTSWTAVWHQANDEVDGEAIQFEQNSWYMNGSSNMNLGNEYTLEISGSYFSPTLSGAVVWNEFSNLNVGLQKAFDNGARLSFSISDIFLGGNYRGQLDDPNIEFQYRGGYIMAERIFRLSYSSRFGNSKLKKARNRQTGASETLQRDN